MDKKFNIAIIGFGHMHINEVALSFHKNPNVRIAAIADTKPDVAELRSAPYTREWNLDRAHQNYPEAKVYDCYHKMLENEQLDLAIITTELRLHGEVVVACAKAGVDVCIEKPMAYNLSDALLMVREVREQGTLLMVNWPIAWSAPSREMQRLAAEGAIGRIIQMRMRTGHSGPLGSGAKHSGVSETAAPMSGYERAHTWWHRHAMGGGSMLDFCCYGCLLSQWFIGDFATSVIGSRANLNSEYGDVEDTSAMIVRFPSAMVILEGTWATFHPGAPGGPILYGTDGTMLQTKDGITIYSADGTERTVAAPPLPEGRDSTAAEYVHHKTTGEPLYLLLERDYNVRAMATLDAGVRSADSGKLETVDSIHWRIG
ncbi:MAG: Gfo/Idh/MocA family oxidoreductase [Oscillospiraceae bacterium]|nr:Gfo/Idh/MocA family oxidoreductase [Oscillospiraceae bacterium]